MNGKKVYVYVGAEWCPKCKVFKPKFEKLCNEKGLEYGIKDADKDSGEIDKWGIRNIPVVVEVDEDGSYLKHQVQDFLDNGTM